MCVLHYSFGFGKPLWIIIVGILIVRFIKLCTLDRRFVTTQGFFIVLLLHYQHKFSLDASEFNRNHPVHKFSCNGKGFIIQFEK